MMMTGEREAAEENRRCALRRNGAATFLVETRVCGCGGLVWVWWFGIYYI